MMSTVFETEMHFHCPLIELQTAYGQIILFSLLKMTIAHHFLQYASRWAGFRNSRWLEYSLEDLLLKQKETNPLNPLKINPSCVSLCYSDVPLSLDIIQMLLLLF